MICCAVGIWLITDLNSRIEQRADVEAALVEQRDDLLGDRIGMDEADLLDLAQIDALDDQRGEVAAKDVEALLADADDLDRLALGHGACGCGRAQSGRSGC